MLCPQRGTRFFVNRTSTTEIYTLSLHDAIPISGSGFEAILAVLDNIETMLIRNDLPTEADTVGRLMDLAESDPAQFIRHLQTGTIWGSSGSISDELRSV